MHYFFMCVDVRMRDYKISKHAIRFTRGNFVCIDLDVFKLCSIKQGLPHFCGSPV